MLFIIHNPANASCRHSSDELSCVEYIKNYDGDTLTFNIKQVHPLLGDQISVRVFGIDTAEMSSKDSCETQMAHAAQQEVERLMKRAQRIDLVHAQRGKFFRVVADIIFDGKSLQEHMLKKKLAVPYLGGHKEYVDWCKFL